MKARCLVVYASKYGATRDIAEAVAEGLSAELVPAADMPDVTPYALVVLGSPIYHNDYLPEMVAFVGRRRADLAGRRVATFICAAARWVAPIGLSGAEDMVPTQQSYADGLAVLSGGDIVAARGFGGRLDPAALDAGDRGALDWVYQYFMHQQLEGFDLLDPAAAYRWGQDLRDVVGG
jgi:menaquinone-dependent protoporphyrinogen oxidase